MCNDRCRFSTTLPPTLDKGSWLRSWTGKKKILFQRSLYRVTRCKINFFSKNFVEISVIDRLVYTLYIFFSTSYNTENNITYCYTQNTTKVIRVTKIYITSIAHWCNRIRPSVSWFALFEKKKKKLITYYYFFSCSKHFELNRFKF